VRKPIYLWRYVLKSREKLNAVSGRSEFSGALIRMGDGFGCLHPWPELGDPGLEDLLEELRSGEVSSGMARSAVQMASDDGYWRGRKQSMIDKVEQDIPESHATLPGCTAAVLEEAVGRGFSTVKLKSGHGFEEQLERIHGFAHRWPGLTWRFDFNEVLNKDEVLGFCRSVADYLKNRIDFLEDPCPWGEGDWAEISQVSGLELALDREVDLHAPGHHVLVLKPVRDAIRMDFPEKRKLVITSNMDHPLGQCYAAWWAGRLASHGLRLGICGLQTHELFETNEFSERLGPAGPRFVSPGGTGLGFDDLLEKLPWKRLS
jgi:O-succinylbenzoate synthase